MQTSGKILQQTADSFLARNKPTESAVKTDIVFFSGNHCIGV